MSDAGERNEAGEATTQALPAGYKLDEYVIEKEIGSGGFGITYRACDEQLNRPVAIKEYFPFNLAARDSSMSVSPKTRVAQDVDEYNWGLSRFVHEARALALFEHPNIIRVIRYIERNNTAYIVMEFAEGRDVSALLQDGGPLSVEQVKDIIIPVASGLASVHSADMLHRDIKPGNIRIRQNGAPVLIDFGAARQAIGVRSQSISTILTPGYAPIEQYSARGNQGPWTDIYALSAVAYVCITGENLSHYEATERIRRDNLPKLADRIEHHETAFLAALDWGLQPEEEDRPQTIDEWLVALKGGGVPDSAMAAPPADATRKIESSDNGDEQRRPSVSQQQEQVTSDKKGGFHWGIIAIVIAVGVAAAMFYTAMDLGKGSGGGVVSVENPPAGKAEPEPKVATVADKPAAEPVVKEPVVKEPVVKKAPVSKPQQPKPQPRDYTQDDSDFELASKINTPEAYQIYLQRHPDGRHRNKIPK